MELLVFEEQTRVGYHVDMSIPNAITGTMRITYPEDGALDRETKMKLPSRVASNSGLRLYIPTR